MNKKINKIYFLGRYQGNSFYKFIPKKIENSRLDEVAGFNLSKKLKRTHLINKANILFFRHKPENTTDLHIQKLTNRISKHNNKLIINNINSFNNYNSKDRAFKIWKENNLWCPDYIVFSNNEINNHKNRVIKKINDFFKKYNKIIIRTNNEAGGNGLYVIEHKKDITATVEELIKKVNTKIKSAKDSKFMCVEYINIDSENNYNEVYRVHILFDKVLSYYIATSKKKQFHQADMGMDDLDRFIEVNCKFQTILPKIKQKLISAVKYLGNNIGAIEFFLINNEPCFIELNPMWGGAAGRGGFGNNEMKEYINSNKSKLYSEIPNIYNWLDYKNYYKNMYEIINQHYEDNFK